MAADAQVTDFRLQATRVAAALVEQASIEIGVLDLAEYAGARAQLSSGQKIYVSFLPRQDWQQTFALCARITADGFDAVPHVPVRTLESARQLEQILTAARQAGVREPLLISGDYPDARRPFSSVLQVLQTGILQAQGFSRVSFAGHPEGHPQVSWDVICEAQVDKWRAASTAGLTVTYVTQFFFAVEPFVHWARYLRAAGVEARLVAGVAGPTGLGRLIKLARHCGVGASLRSLTARPAATVRLFGEHAPDDLLTRLAAEKLQQPPLFDGLHVFSLGGFARSVAWLRRTRGG